MAIIEEKSGGISLYFIKALDILPPLFTFSSASSIIFRYTVFPTRSAVILRESKMGMPDFIKVARLSAIRDKYKFLTIGPSIGSFILKLSSQTLPSGVLIK